MKLFGTLRITTNQLLLVGGNVPERLSGVPTMDVRLLSDENGKSGDKTPTRFLSLDAGTNLPIFDAERDTITVFGELSEKPAFDDLAGVTRNVPLFKMASFARHDDIAVRAFEKSLSGQGASPEEDWLGAEDELLAAN